ncbi:uncharacterized protein OCT59_024012 [Rhizophagus irregularis]|uniref:Uncharacterized protein n=1 Tax=Rhizophagus irregularis (strain DAOM 181602 / DAOM 197198 / MUCL 43194) TaxID=747089 RepID=U9T8N1_RHIID|nr:hypothetical protein OCT59_024012 [Rhizophagus irregularis]GBC22139.1 kinase-like domain-containing protein [Rhizophagus irregularis DAOM 181602=DAOM 197198]
MSNNSELKVINNSNEWIEESIVKKRIKYYDHKHFNNIQEIGFGNFERVYRANWKNSHGFLALKSFINFDITDKGIVNKLKLQREVDFHENIIRFYSITTEIQCDNSKKYLLMMEYADSGTLRNYLSERFENLTWNDKLNLAFQLVDAISYLHDKEIMYHDLRSDSISVHRNIIKLADFGLSNRNEMVAYVDPQIFIINSDKKCDIYNTGILLWEISSGKSPFCKELHDVSLGTPEDYVQIYTDCWSDDRPTINQVVEKLNAFILKESIQLSSKQQLHENITNSSLYGNMSQSFQNFSKVIIKEIEPSILSNLIINDFEIMIAEMIFLLENIKATNKKHKVINYLNNHNLTSQEIYNWLLNNQDNSDSVFLLGLFNHFGIEINIDEQKAFEFYQKAANAGHASGITSLGYCYHCGIGTSIDNQKAFELYQEAANLGNTRGIYNLGVCYNNGVGTSIDYQKAFELYQESANLGNVLGLTGLEYCYSFGIGTSVDKQKAYELYQKSAIYDN